MSPRKIDVHPEAVAEARAAAQTVSNLKHNHVTQ
jgi:hypothetical protein